MSIYVHGCLFGRNFMGIPHLNSEDKQKKENLANEFFPFDHTYAASKLLVALIKLWRPDPLVHSCIHKVV